MSCGVTKADSPEYLVVLELGRAQGGAAEKPQGQVDLLAVPEGEFAV